MEAWLRSNVQNPDQVVRGVEDCGGVRAVALKLIRSNENGEISMSIEENVQVVKDFFAAIGRGDKQRVLALVAEDIEWIVPGENWPLAGTRSGHAGIANMLHKASEEVETTYPSPPSSLRRETGFWSSASLRGRSKLRIRRSRTSGSSTSPFETAS
jgi:hypothetical protein